MGGEGERKEEGRGPKEVRRERKNGEERKGREGISHMYTAEALFDTGWCRAKTDSRHRETRVTYLEWDIIFFLQAASCNPLYTHFKDLA